jgi:ribosomal protein S4E
MSDIADGDHVRVTGGTHKGKSGVAQDRNVSKTGHVTITVKQDDGICFKTLARNVSVEAR